MSYPVWPFLVGCSKRFDYRTVVAPDFLCEAHKPALLSNTVRGELTAPHQAFLYQFIIRRPITLDGIQTRSIILVYRVIEARSEYVGLEGNDVLRDKAGRPIYLVEGLVSLLQQPSSPPWLIVSKEDLDALHELVQRDYQVFWNETSSDIPSAVPSRRLNQELGNGVPLEYIEPNSRSIDHKFFLPDKLDVWMKEGDTSLRDKDYQGALEAFERAIQLNPQYAPAYIARGNIFLDQAASIPTFLNPSFLNPSSDRERTTFYEQALEAFDRAIQLTHEKDDRSDAYALKGRALVDLKRQKPAFEALFEALQLNSGNRTAHEGMQKLYKSHGVIDTLSR